MPRAALASVGAGCRLDDDAPSPAPPADPTASVDIRDVGADASGSALVAEPVNSPEQVLEVLNRGSRARTTGSTRLNDRSSRSHAVLRLSIRLTRRLGGEVDDDEAEGLTVDTAVAASPMSSGVRTPVRGGRRLPTTGSSSPRTARGAANGSLTPSRGARPPIPPGTSGSAAGGGGGGSDADAAPGLEVITSVIHLVDLAGSEKVSQSGVTGDRLKVRRWWRWG